MWSNATAPGTFTKQNEGTEEPFGGVTYVHVFKYDIWLLFGFRHIFQHFNTDYSVTKNLNLVYAERVRPVYWPCSLSGVWVGPRPLGLSFSSNACIELKGSSGYAWLLFLEWIQNEEGIFVFKDKTSRLLKESVIGGERVKHCFWNTQIRLFCQNSQ